MNPFPSVLFSKRELLFRSVGGKVMLTINGTEGRLEKLKQGIEDDGKLKDTLLWVNAQVGSLFLIKFWGIQWENKKQSINLIT